MYSIKNSHNFMTFLLIYFIYIYIIYLIYFLVLKHKRIIQESLYSVQTDLLFINVSEVIPVQISKCSIQRTYCRNEWTQSPASSQLINKKQAGQYLESCSARSGWKQAGVRQTWNLACSFWAWQKELSWEHTWSIEFL